MAQVEMVCGSNRMVSLMGSHAADGASGWRPVCVRSPP